MTTPTTPVYADLPPLGEPTMKETNPYLGMDSDPYNGLSHLQWFGPAAVRAAQREAIAHHIARNAASGQLWPWAMKWWKPKSPRQDLVRAAALILAEIERLDRKESTK